MEKVKVAIIGAGVVGLAIAETLSRKIDGDIVVFEKHDKFGQETSSRNSEVIHAGIYYPKNSLKSALCLRGNKMLYDICKKEGIKYKNCDKLIISTNDSEAKRILSIHENAVSVGVPGLSLLTKNEIADLEPNIFALNGIFSETTGIIDSHGLMNYLCKSSESNGAMFSFGNEVTGIVRRGAGGGGLPAGQAGSSTDSGYILRTSDGEEILSEFVINSAGLLSDKIARMAGFDIDALHYNLHFCKGDYFSIKGSSGKLNHLVYPVPHEKGHGLGVHATLDLDGYIRLGPDTEYVDRIYYDIDPKKRLDFYKAAKTYLPWLNEEMLAPDTSGMRPKLQGPDDAMPDGRQGFRDFIIKEESENGFPGFINLIGIESPGLTSCLAIGKFILNLL
ncbi:NAD(P)/FAD-dependent oxidoreductase [Candidatus Saganbacteria bacterium]|nr:NAD(P)/FAD-dependent oxidoreductase [Candidatus Saganbacteria bacterium]